MNVIDVVSDIYESNMYILSEFGHAIIIDPCRDLSCFDETLIYDWIILTHEHIDHISGVNLWKEKSGAKVICSSSCAKNIKNPQKNLSRHFDVFNELQTFYPKYNGTDINNYICEADYCFEKKKSLSWQGHKIEMCECPGHSEGSILVIFDDVIVFSGDSLLKDYPTACRFPGGNTKLWKEVGIPIIKSLNSDCHVYPGHFKNFVLKEKDLTENNYV